MLTVRLHGHLEDKFGSEFQFDAKTVREVVDALQANFSDFTEEFIKDQRAYNILIDNDATDIVRCTMPLNSCSTVDIVPIIAGAGNTFLAIGLIIIGALLIIASSGAAAGWLAVAAANGSAAAGLAVSAIGAIGGMSTIAAIGWGLVLAGVASLLAGPDGPDGDGGTSTTFSGMDNVVGQGIPVPIGYGRLLVGSFVISATYMSSETYISRAVDTQDANGIVTNHQENFGTYVPQVLVGDEGYVYSTIPYPQGMTEQEKNGLNEAMAEVAAQATITVEPVNAGTRVIGVPRYIPGSGPFSMSDWTRRS
jgi:predicted phage tail protein